MSPHGKAISILLGLGFSLLPAMAPAELTLGLNQATGSLVATDLWRTREYEAMRIDSGRMPDLEKGGLSAAPGPGHYRLDFTLAETVELARDGTNLTFTFLIAKYSASGTMNPRDFYRTFWVEARDQNGALGATYYGYASGYPSHYEDHVPLSRLLVETVHKEKTEAGEYLWLLKVQGTVTLTRPVTYLPDLKIDFSNLTRHLEFTRLQKRAMTLFQQWQPPVATAPKLTNHPPAQLAASTNLPTPPSKTPASVLPGVTLAIAKQDNLLLITFSPEVAGASLEQAALNTTPWVWQPAVTVTNRATNGWHVAPTPEPRVFRIRLDQ